METEKDNKLAFLDTAVLREPDGRLTISVYRKPTHTDQYLAYNSHHPQSLKCETYQDRKPKNSGEPANEFKNTAVLPYVKDLSAQLHRCLQQQGVHAIFKSETTLRSRLVRPEDAVDPAKQDGVVYRIPCECSKVYIGETGRPMQDRIKEHGRDIRFSRYRDLRRFRTCPQHRTQATLERSKVYRS
ncbi:uncharacterized protein [Pocillopora verrucosa]|uniref:uncharacterized protein n=1 Tax=Pocillopora verrucosa TaxID=203993 RepID=UPI00333EF460